MRAGFTGSCQNYSQQDSAKGQTESGILFDAAVQMVALGGQRTALGGQDTALGE